MKRLVVYLSLGLAILFYAALFAGGVAGCGGGEEQAPGIPHATSQTDDAYCLGCHQTGANGAKVTPHPTRTGCATCHKPQA